MGNSQNNVTRQFITTAEGTDVNYQTLPDGSVEFSWIGKAKFIKDNDKDNDKYKLDTIKTIDPSSIQIMQSSSGYTFNWSNNTCRRN